MSMDKIQQIVGSIAKLVEHDIKAADGNTKIAIPLLAVKLAKSLEANPYDQTIGLVSRVINKLADKNTFFIKRADFNKLYNQYYVVNTKFAQLFGDELGELPQLATPQIYSRDDSSVIDTYESADPVLANALTSAFDKTIPLKMYSQKLAERASNNVLVALDAWGLKPSKLEIAEGNEKFIIVRADYESPKGITSFYVPVAIDNGNIVNASMFMCNSGVRDLNHLNIKQYLTSFAGSKLVIKASSILDLLVKNASTDVEISDAELALTRLHASREIESDSFGGGIVGLKVSEASVKDVELSKSSEFESFEKEFTSAKGVANFQFGAEKVATARESLKRDLVGFGFRNPQIVVTANNENTIFYGVSLDSGKIGFTVPMKVVAGKISKPNVLVCNGSVSSFTRESVHGLYEGNADYKIVAVASPQYDLKPNELINSVREGVAEENFAKVEDALNILAQGSDSKAYTTAFNIYLESLSKPTVKTASKACTCSMIVNSSVSVHPICGHTGLPVHKVYQDQHGNCRPLYRRDMEDTYEGASFMNAKILG